MNACYVPGTLDPMLEKPALKERSEVTRSVFLLPENTFQRSLWILILRRISFLGLCNKLSWAWGLTAREIFSFTVVEARILKWRCWQDHGSSRGSRGDPSLPVSVSGSSRQVFLGWWWCHSNLSQSTWLSPPLRVSSLCTSKSTLVFGLRAHRIIQEDLTSRFLTTCAKILFPNEVRFTGSGDYNMDMSSWRPPLNPLHQERGFIIFSSTIIPLTHG